MRELSGIFFLGFILLFTTVAIVRYRRNRRFLTPEERQKAGELLRNNGWGKKLFALFIPIYSILLISSYFGDYYAGIEKAKELIFIFFLLPIGYGILRNCKIYRKADLPQKFVRGELNLGIFMLLAYA
jgi:4-hydroxybenzoate polyprenyltransferase